MNRPAEISDFITFIYVTDLEESHQFYQEILGLSLWLDQGRCRIYTITSAGKVGICQADARSKGQPQPAGRDHVILTLVTENVDAFYPYLLEQGVEIEHHPKDNPTYDIYHFFVRDPDGYLIEIQRFETRS